LGHGSDNAGMHDFTDLRRDTLSRHLRKHLEGEVRADATSRRLYSTDASIYQIEPLCVVIPKTVADLVATVQVAGEMHIPITARGGGTSLSGQSIGSGVVIDCSKYLNRILDIDPVARIARVQPGVVLDQLNRALAEHNLFFGPEVSTASRANLGGMIGNNSAGSRSIVYGKTAEHVRSLDVILADSSQTVFAPLDRSEWQRRSALRSLEGTIYRSVGQVVAENAEEIRRRFPNIPRRVSGYNLDALCKSLMAGAGNGSIRMTDLVVGSEGTLAIVTAAELGILERPRHRGLLIVHFESLASAMDTVAACLEFEPSAIELLDRMLLELARGNLALRDTMAMIVGRPAAVFMVEFVGDDAAQVADRIERLGKRLALQPGVTAVVPAVEPAQRESLWNLRTAALPLLYGVPGDQKPVTFVEDVAVSPALLPEFIARFQEILARHGTSGAFYGHASVGCLHIRPLLNLKEGADVQRMRRITEDVTDLVLEFGGALSGEHGDGLARSEWNQKMFGPAVYEAFRSVKAAFDPQNVLNPGKVVDGPAMTENLRYGPGYTPVEPETIFEYPRQLGFVRAIETCNGSGVCRKREGGTMCPSFRATLDEKDSTRGRANALRLALSGAEPLRNLRSHWVQEVLDLCLMCKACKSECPANVDMAKLKSEVMSMYYDHRPRPLGHYLLAGIHQVDRLGAPAAPLVNWFQARRPIRWLMEKIAGIDQRRSLPKLHADHFRRWFARHQPAAQAGRHGRVLLLDDCFTTFNEPELGRAAVRVLEAAGYEVRLAGIRCCCRPMLSKGFLHPARELVQAQVHRLARQLDDGIPLLGLEPSCLLTIADDWPELFPSPDTQRVAAAATLADHWLAARAEESRLDLRFKQLEGSCVIHGHCHQKAIVGVKGSAGALRLVPGLRVHVLDTGCCGMAGSFGFEKEHYDLSVAIANLSVLPALAASPNSLVVATGTSCRHQIRDLAGRHASHPLEVLNEQLVG
jgi:FAD/FMN-containing dehydrogenase/Fe-S oxidoreductase